MMLPSRAKSSFNYVVLSKDALKVNMGLETIGTAIVRTIRLGREALSISQDRALALPTNDCNERALYSLIKM